MVEWVCTFPLTDPMKSTFTLHIVKIMRIYQYISLITYYPTGDVYRKRKLQRAELPPHVLVVPVALAQFLYTEMCFISSS